MQPDDLANLTNAAAAVGVNKSTVSRYLSQGVLANHGGEARPLVSVAELRALREKGLDPAKRRSEAPAPVPASADSSLAVERIRKTRAEADKAELDLAERQRTLVERGPVEDAGFEIGVMLRNLLAQRAPGLAQKLVGVVDQRAAALIVEEADRALLAKLDEMVAKILTEAGIGDAVA
ncbi:hypothetical protein [Azospirillum sp. ST 5-10]|uniref:hypothetical protein n=1 Tax=unclassified Azospirillum TaxID=2630922 RepID=UPI003F49C0A8